jgi:hypothetical protein
MKILAWCVIGAGLLPCIWIGMMGLLLLHQIMLMERVLGMYRNSPNVYMHDQYYRIQFGVGTLEVYPRVWSVTLLMGGIAAIIVALVFLMHVPLAESNGFQKAGSAELSP